MVARDIIKEIRENIKDKKQELSSARYIGYQNVENIDGDYYLLRSGKKLKPLRSYLASNEVGIEQIVSWLQTILDLFSEAESLDLNWSGIIPESLWVNEKDEIFIIDPIITEKITQYREQLKFDFEEKVLLPPEILAGDNWGPKSQIYSISSFFYYLLTSKPLFEQEESGKTMAKIKQIKPLSPQIINPNLSTALSALLLNCLAKDKVDRPEKFSAVIARVKNLVNQKQIFSSAEEKKEIKDKQDKKKKMFKFKQMSFWFIYKYGKFTAVLVVCIGVLMGFVFTGGYDPVIDKKTSSQEVVNYFYESIKTKNINLFEETINPEQLPHIESMVMNGYIIETAKSLFSAPPQSSTNKSTQNNNLKEKKKMQQAKKRIFQIENLKINKIEAGPTPEYKANYYFVFLKNDISARIKMNDRIILNKIKGQWKIEKIVGDIQNRQFLEEKEKILKEKKGK